MNKIQLMWWRLMFKLFVSSGLYGLWSHIYRTIWEHKYSHITLPIVESVEELAAIAAKMEWTADGWKQLRDAVSSPEAVWDKFQHGLPVGDCDDFAAFNSNVLMNSIRAGKCKNILFADMMTVSWSLGSTVAGHNVTLLCRDDGKHGVMDYGMPHWFTTLKEAREFILREYTDGAPCIGWAVSDPVTLRVYESGDR